MAGKFPEKPRWTLRASKYGPVSALSANTKLSLNNGTAADHAAGPPKKSAAKPPAAEDKEPTPNS